jgi:hypothetical protein
MDWQGYRKRLESLGSALTTNSQFRAVFEAYEPFSDTDFEDLTNDIIDQGGISSPIWPGFREFYRSLDGFRLQWQYLGQEAVGTRTGSVQIAMIPDIYLPEDAPADSVKRMFQEPRLLDLVGPDDHVALRLHEGGEAPDLLYFSDVSRQYYPLSLNFEAYLAMVLEARAMYRWQHFFISDPAFHLSKEQATAFRNSLTSLFPDADVAKFPVPGEK